MIAIFQSEPGCRPIGASIVPVNGSGWPWTSAWYVLSTERERKARFKIVYAISLLATTISPDVPTSRRCTMPRRSGTPEVEIRKPAPARWDSTSGPSQPRLGWAATPTGLSTTTMSASSCTIRTPATIWGTMAAAGRSSSSTSSMAPELTRSDLTTVAPSTRTRPWLISSVAQVRDRPSIRAIAASTRSPSRPSGTRTTRASVTSGLGPVQPDVADHGQHHDQDGGSGDAHVGHVEDRPLRQLQEVDHVAAERTGRPEEPVGQVSAHPGTEQTQG